MKRPVKLALVLTVLTTIAATLLSVTARMSHEQRQSAQHQYLQKQLARVAPSAFNNNPLREAKQFPNGDIVYPFYQKQSLLGYAIATTATDGYSGNIQLLVGVNAKHRITAVYPLSHRETAGLGDRIEPQHSDWINGFIGISQDAPFPYWKSRKDGGRFADLTGATITARAVLNQVQRTAQQHLEWQPRQSR